MIAPGLTLPTAAPIGFLNVPPAGRFAETTHGAGAAVGHQPEAHRHG